MIRSITLELGEQSKSLGVLRYDQQGAREHASFEYSAAWLAATDRFAIAPDLSLLAGPQFHQKSADGTIFHAAIADTEPDGWGKKVIQRDHAKRRQLERRKDGAAAPHPLNAMDYLLAVDDHSRIGALRLRDEQGVYQRTLSAGSRRTPPLVDIAQLLHATRAVELQSETAADLAFLRGRGTSLGGLRPKCSVLDLHGQLAIAKFPSVNDERAVTKGEVLAMVLAKKAGINAAEARLIDSDGAAVALIRRFDRGVAGARLMYISAATMLGSHFSESGEHSYTEIVDALRRYGHAPLPDIEELWRRIAFSILITNVDDHLRNHGFLHADRGQWRLSPAFDINPFPERVRELKTWISEDAGPDSSIDALLSARGYFGISPMRAKQILSEVDAAIATWRIVGRSLGMTAHELNAFTDAFEHIEREHARQAFR
jgi:serine/threonine-protein kinase HipA